MIIIRPLFSFYIFFYTLTFYAFVFYLLRFFCIFHDHIVAFFFFSSLERIWYLCCLFIILIAFSWWTLDIVTYTKNLIKKLLEGIKMLKVNFVMTWIIYKVLMLLKITRILKCFLRSIIDFYLKKKIHSFYNI